MSQGTQTALRSYRRARILLRELLSRGAENVDSRSVELVSKIRTGPYSGA